MALNGFARTACYIIELSVERPPARARAQAPSRITSRKERVAPRRVANLSKSSRRVPVTSYGRETNSHSQRRSRSKLPGSRASRDRDEISGRAPPGTSLRLPLNASPLLLGVCGHRSRCREDVAPSSGTRRAPLGKAGAVPWTVCRYLCFESSVGNSTAPAALRQVSEHHRKARGFSLFLPPLSLSLSFCSFYSLLSLALPVAPV